MALCGNCGLDTEPEDVVPLDSCVEASGSVRRRGARHQLVTVGDSARC